MEKLPTIKEIKTLSLESINVIINQLESAMSDILLNGTKDQATKLNCLIGNCIDIYNEKRK